MGWQEWFGYSLVISRFQRLTMTDSALTYDARPFTSTPFVKHYFPARSIECSLASARRCIARGAGPVVVMGSAGMGKSLLMMKLEEEFRSEFSVVHLACARLDDRRELLQSILFELQLPYQDMSEGELRLSLMDHLKLGHQCPSGVLLLIDEAQNLTVELLDEVRLITNLVRDGHPRLRLVMAGNGRLEDRLNDPKLASLNQRIAARCYLESLSQAETAEYVVTHLDRFGGNGRKMFPASSLRAIHELSEGCPRSINQLCDHVLVLGFEKRVSQIDETMIRLAWSEVQCLPCSSQPQKSELHAGFANELTADFSSDSVVEFGSLDGENETVEFFGSPSVDDSYSSRSKKVWTEPATQEPVSNHWSDDGFNNPFAESFALEENVIDQYLPLVVDRNRKSLDVSSDDLASLQPLDLVSENAAVVSCGTDSSSEASTRFSITQHEEGDDFEGDHFEGEFAPAFDIAGSAATNDDRDLLLVNRVETPQFAPKSKRETSVPYPVTNVSTGGAVRMDYQRLFEQLRTIPS